MSGTNEIHHRGTEYAAVCPHCGHEHEGAWEWHGRCGSTACDKCGGGFDWQRETVFRYDTHPALAGEIDRSPASSSDRAGLAVGSVLAANVANPI